MTEQTYDSAPEKCQRCGEAMKPIVYGMATSELFEAAGRGELILGGCLVDDGDPTSGCSCS